MTDWMETLFYLGSERKGYVCKGFSEANALLKKGGAPRLDP